MNRCIVYLENQTQQDMWCTGFSGLWGRYNQALAPPRTGRLAVASLPIGAGQDYGWLMFARRWENGPTKYYQLYIHLRNINDCMEMGTAECTQDDVDHSRGVRINATMPSNGTMDADKQTAEALIQWRCAWNNEDPIALNNMPVVFLTFNR